MKATDIQGMYSDVSSMALAVAAALRLAATKEPAVPLLTEVSGGGSSGTHNNLIA